MFRCVLRKCRYCDFLSFSADASIKRDYVEALKREIEARGRWFREKGGYRLYSVFIGGGTPSILEGGQVGESSLLRVECIWPEAYDKRSDP